MGILYLKKGNVVHFRIYIIISLLGVNSFGSDANKTKVFNDKYLSSQKLDKYQDTKINIDYKISDITNMTTISKDTNSSATNLIKNITKSQAMSDEASAINDFKNSKYFQKEILKNEEYILYDKKINWQQHLGRYKNSSNHIIKSLKEKGSVSATFSSNKYLDHNEKIFIIISSSIPEHILKNYFEMLQNVNTDVTFVLRGTIGGVKKIMPTLNWIKKVTTKKDNSRYEYNIIIEPRISTKYNIEKVPALLYIKNYDEFYIQRDTDEMYYIHYGAVDVDYALEKINLDVKSKGLKKLLEKI